MARTRTITMPRTGDSLRTARSTRYVLAAQYRDAAPRIVQGSADYQKLRTALDRRLRKPFTYTNTHARPDYAIFDLPTGDVLAQSKGDG